MVVSPVGLDELVKLARALFRNGMNEGYATLAALDLTISTLLFRVRDRGRA
jgi:hypothetical protein